MDSLGIHRRLFFILMTVLCNDAFTEDCGQEELTACSKPLQILAETTQLSFVTRKEELMLLCPDLQTGLNCIRSYTRRCMNVVERNHFNKLYLGTSQVIQELCREGSYQEDFLQHAPCLRRIKTQQEQCASRYQRSMSLLSDTAFIPEATYNESVILKAEQHRIESLCCAFKEYIACSEATVQESCGENAANFTREFLDKISSTLMITHCEHLEPEPGKCGVPNKSIKFDLNFCLPLAILLTVHTYFIKLFT